MLRTVAVLCVAGAAAGTTPTPPPPPGTRYHCDGVGNCAESATEGHHTMAKCVAACPKPAGVFTQSTFTDKACSEGEKDNKLPIGTCLGMTGGSGSAIVKSCDSSGVTITQYTSSDCSGKGTAGTQPVDQCVQATAGGYLKNTCSSVGVGSATATLALPLATPAAHDAGRQRLIDETNAKQDEWTAHHNLRFRGAPVGVSKSLCGVLPGEDERLAAHIKSGEIEMIEADPTLAIPDSFEAADGFPQCAKVINDIRDQSNCGCCWAFSAAEAASDRLCIATNASSALPLSAQDMCFCSNSNGCGGGSQASAWNYIKSHGLVTGSQQQPDDGATDPFAGGGYCSSFSLPHCHHHGPTGSDPYPAEGAKGCPSESSPRCPTKCDASAKAPHNVFGSDKYKVSGVASYRNADAMAQAIMTKGPISVGFTVYSDFENYASGIYHHTGGSSLGGHAVRIVGFGVSKGASGRQYWKVANSWNPYWGEKGYFRIRRGTNEVGIEGQAVASSASATWTIPK